MPNNFPVRYVIWSFEHDQWWGPGHAGYTPNLEAAGRYTALEAGEIVTASVMGEEVALLYETAQMYGRPTVRGLWQTESA
jgi:hypothetical protein